MLVEFSKSSDGYKILQCYVPIAYVTGVAREFEMVDKMARRVPVRMRVLICMWYAVYVRARGAGLFAVFTVYR